MIHYDNNKDSYSYNRDSVDFFINIGLVVTRMCNFQCIHCCETPNSEKSDLSDIKKIVDELSKNNLKKYVLLAENLWSGMIYLIY